MADVFGEMFGGTLVCDFFGAYNFIIAADKQRCIVHLFRALKSAMAKNKTAEWAAFYKKLKWLKRCRYELFTFVGDPAVSPDNNLAERHIRPGVVMRKNSYCNRSERGAETQAILMSLFRILHLRGADPVETLRASLQAALVTGDLLPLPCPPTSGG